MFYIVVALVLIALIFDYINGFHDAANSIATVVSTRVLSPGLAVLWAAFFNFAAAAIVRLYRLESVRFGARELAHIITASTEQVGLAVGALESHKGVTTHAIEINRLENEADRIHQQAVGRLFDEERDPMVVMKWKETFDFLEGATDRCEDVANVIEGVMVKHG